MILCLDAGHGKGDANQSPDGSYKEWIFTQEVVNLAKPLIEQYGIKVIKTKEMNSADISLTERCNIANRANADIFISVHSNAHGSGAWTSANGIETFHFPNSKTGNKLATIAQKYCVEKTGLTNRGVKSANFAVLRQTNMPACLIEFGFHTHKGDCEKLKSPQFKQKCAEVILYTVLEWFGISSQQNNNSQQNQPSQEKLYDMSILGKPYLTAEHLNQFVKSKNSEAPEIADYYIDYGNQLGIRGDIAFCQAILETGYFKYGGDVNNNQNNFCGLGATGGVKGAEFDTPRQGVLAHLQHLWAYATNKPLPEGMKIYDPRFSLVTRGIADTWFKLNGKWAIPGTTYGQDIIKIYGEAKQFIPTINKQEETPKKPEYPKKEEVKKVLFTCSNISNSQLPSVVIDGKGYIAVSDVSKLINLNVVWDTILKEIVFYKEGEI